MVQKEWWRQWTERRKEGGEGSQISHGLHLTDTRNMGMLFLLSETVAIDEQSEQQSAAEAHNRQQQV